MKIAIIAAMLLAGLYSVAGAQEATPSPTPDSTSATVQATPPAAAQAGPQKFWLEVDQNDLQAISLALMELPKKIADPLVLKLNAQLQAQQQIVESKGKDAADKAKKGKK